MKKFLVFFSVMSFLFFSAGVVGATYIVDPSTGWHGYTTFYADLDEDGTYDGDTADDWSITDSGWYTVSVGISDAFLYGDYFDVFVDGALIGTTPIVSKTGSDGYSAGSFDVLLEDGPYIIDFVDVLLRDYYLIEGPAGFDGTVTASYSPAGAYVDISATASVPEPATMLLLGSGLIGLGVLGRKKLFKK